ncbi:hypothetical protein C8R46DRAFT_1081279, partial [Mycena filopes]
MDTCPVPKLVHLRTRFCHPDSLNYIWSYCSNLRVVEMQGGSAEDFWRANAKDVDADTEYPGRPGITVSVFLTLTAVCVGHYDLETGIHSFLFDTNTVPEEPPLFSTVSTIKVISDAPDAHSDAWHFVSHFRGADPEDYPPTSLKEWFLDLSLTVGAFRVILSHLRTPVIERLGFRAAIEADWLPADFDAYLVSLAPDDSTFFAGFQSLTELLLPCDGLSAR